MRYIFTCKTGLLLSAPAEGATPAHLYFLVHVHSLICLCAVLVVWLESLCDTSLTLSITEKGARVIVGSLGPLRLLVLQPSSSTSIYPTYTSIAYYVQVGRRWEPNVSYIDSLRIYSWADAYGEEGPTYDPHMT